MSKSKNTEQDYYDKVDEDQTWLAKYVRDKGLLAYGESAGELPELDEDGSYKTIEPDEDTE